MVKTIGNVQKDAQVRAVASGTLSNGDTVIVNSDGTVSAVAETSITGDVGTPVIFSDANTRYNATAFDANSGKVVVAYMDVSESNEGNARVGTIDTSDNSISWGAETTFETGDVMWLAGTYAETAQKVVFAYRDDSNAGYGTAVVGTVSGTTVTFGSPVVWAYTQVQYVDITYDSANDRVVIVYEDDDNSDYGTSVVGTVSGSSISFGTPVVFESSASAWCAVEYDANAEKVLVAFKDGAVGDARVGTVSGTSISYGSNAVFANSTTDIIGVTYDSSAQKCVISYQDGGNGDKGTAIVATISGTSVTFGTEVVFNNATTSNTIFPLYNTAAGKVVIAYRDTGGGNQGEFVTGTVSGTSITFDTAQEFESGTTNFISGAYDSTNNLIVLCYEDEGNSDKGTSVVVRNAYNEPNLTSDNFIGFADGAYADTQNAVINTTCSVDRSQTSLTAGQKYYVQTDGSLSETADDPSVEAGTAISSTEILVKG